MKKLFTLLLCLLLISGSVFAYSANGNKVYDLKSDLYEAITQLYIMTGHALPSTTGPYSESELVHMLSKIPKDSLPEYGKSIYEYVEAELKSNPYNEEKKMGIDWDINANLEVYAHTNSDDERFQTKYNWGFGVNEQAPMLAFALETWPLDHFYGYAEFSFGNYILTGDNNSAEFGANKFHTNVLGLQNVPAFNIAMLNLNMPYRAFASAGGDGWLFQVGRERLSWGPGVSGNLTIGDHIQYHNMARITTFTDNFKYTFMTSFLPHPQNYYNSTAGTPKADGSEGIEDHSIISTPKNSGIWQGEIVSGVKMFMSHRLEGRFFNDKLNFALTESIIYQNASSTLDLAVINPSMIYHSYYIRNMANSLLSVELDYTPINHLNIYGQFVVDEFAMPGENWPGSTSSAFPNGFGYMLGVKGNYPLQTGILTGSLEFVKTDPYLYLRYSDEDQLNQYGLNYIGAVRSYSDAQGVSYKEDALGYKYGNDAMAINLNVGYKQYGKWEVEGNALFLWDGTYDIWTIWSRVSNGEDTTKPVNPTSPTKETEDMVGNYKDPNAKHRDSVSFMTNLTLKGSYSILDYLKVYGQLDFYNIQNPGNKADANAINDVQFTIGVGYSF